MRERTTWQNKGREINRQAATSRRAEDIYSMNGEHPQPTPDQYMAPNAGPDMWAETPANYDTSLVKADYDAKGHVKRNEVGFAEFQAPTFDRPAWGAGKYDNHKYASSERKALASHRLASNLLRTQNRELIRKVAVGFMALPDAALNNALKAVQETSPAAMSDEARFKRAYACTKLAARMLGDSADEPSVERLARSIFQIDDPTLKSMIKIVAASKSGSEEGGSKEPGSKEPKAAAKKPGSKSEASKSGVPGSKEPKAAATKKEGSGSWGSKSEMSGSEHSASEHSASEGSSSASASASAKDALTGSEEHSGSEHSSSTDAMLSAMMGDVAPAAPAPVAPAAPMGDVAPAAPAPSVMMASDISFDDDSSPMTVHTSALEALFADDPEVKAQREISAAQRESVARAAGYSVERTASVKGAKKLGSVKAAKETSPEANLSALWDRL
jgi:hypothetical protein